jgi:hypothetical protein
MTMSCLILRQQIWCHITRGNVGKQIKDHVLKITRQGHILQKCSHYCKYKGQKSHMVRQTKNSRAKYPSYMSSIQALTVLSVHIEYEYIHIYRIYMLSIPSLTKVMCANILPNASTYRTCISRLTNAMGASIHIFIYSFTPSINYVSERLTSSHFYTWQATKLVTINCCCRLSTTFRQQ